MKVFCSWSGGKESALSYYEGGQGTIEIVSLINMISTDGKRSRSHGLNTALLKMQADAMGTPLIQSRTSWKGYEGNLKKVLGRLRDEGITAGIFGDIDVVEHKEWVERVCAEVGMQAFLPLWKMERRDLLKKFIDSGFEAVVVAVNTESLGKEWLGRKIDEDFVQEIEAEDVDICGENGEYHTFVYNGPIFRKPVSYKVGEKVRKKQNYFLELIP